MRTTTPHEAFSLMLLERIGRLEDELLHIQQTIPNQIPYEWYCYHFSTPIEMSEAEAMEEDVEVSIERLREKCIDVLFQNRSHTDPEFAYWHWYIKSNTNRYELKVYIRYRIPITKNKLNISFGEIPNTISFEIIPMHGGSSDIRMMLTERLGYSDVFPYSTPDLGVELWRRGGDSMDVPLEERWTNDRFTMSLNYNTGYDEHLMLQDKLLRWIRMKRWADLFRLSE